MSATGHSGFGVVAITGSQGARGALEVILTRLPATFSTSVVVALHRAPGRVDSLVPALRRSTSLPIREVDGAAALRPGAIHVGPSGSDLVVVGPQRLVARPAAHRPVFSGGDTLLTSAAAEFGERAIGVVLSGRLGDGALGARRIKAAGGRILVQTPASAEARAMPDATLATGCVDFTLEPTAIADALISLVMVPGAADLFRVRSHPGMALTA